MRRGPFLPAADLASFTAALPARAPGGGVKVLSYNVNGLRAALRADRRDAFLAWLAREAPDVIALQEVRADAEAIEREALAAAFAGSHPHAVFASGEPRAPGFKKGYAGVALFSRAPPLRAHRGVGGAPAHDAAGRLVAATFAFGTVACVYAPNSGAKLERLDYRTREWDAALRARLADLARDAPGGRLLVVGDFNVALSDADVAGFKEYRNKIAGFCDGERDNFATLLRENALRDVWREANPDTVEFSAWRWGARGSRASREHTTRRALPC
jgi:exodeoxyribonuclease III